jgi:tetratricopeptide (TPR) repeat protein
MGNGNKVGGFIGYFNLDDWWINTFSNEERKYIREKASNNFREFDNGEISDSSLNVSTFLYSLSTYLKAKNDKPLYDRIQEKLDTIDLVNKNKKFESIGQVTDKGFIYFYNLQDWWLSEFTEKERDFISHRFNPCGYSEDCLSQEKCKSPLSLTAFMYALNYAFFGLEYIAVNDRIEKKYKEIVNKFGEDQPGFISGRHFSTYVGKICELENNQDYENAVALLEKCIVSSEIEEQFIYKRFSGGPYYYERLAIIYRKLNRPDKEIQILERYIKLKDGSENKKMKFLTRIEKVKASKK